MKRVWILLVFLLALSTGALLYGMNDGISCEDCNVVVVSVEPVRQDHLGVYGYERNTSPNIDRFAEESLVFDDAYTNTPNTLSSTISTFTSLYLNQHKVSEFGKWEGDGNFSQPSIVDALNRNGYHTMAVEGSNTGVRKLGYGFDSTKKSSNYTTQSEIDGMMAEADSQGKFFLFYQFYSGHVPYVSSDTSAERFPEINESFRRKTRDRYDEIFSNESLTQKQKWEAIREFYIYKLRENPELRDHLKAEYDGEIRDADRRFGRVIEAVERQNLKNDTVIVFMSEHGESLGEHDRWYHKNLYNEVIKVPLIVRIPGQKSKRVKSQVELIDLGPTLLEIVGAEKGSFRREATGSSMLPLIAGESSGSDAIAQYTLRNQKAIVDAETDLKFYADYQKSYLFNLSSDPEEENPLDNRELKQRLVQKYEDQKGEGRIGLVAPWPYDLNKK